MKSQPHHPDIIRPDSVLITISTWRVDDPGILESAADSIAGIRNHADYPQELLSHNVYLGIDKNSVLQYSQWIGNYPNDSILEKQHQESGQKVIDQTPGLELIDNRGYRLYKSMISYPVEQNRKPGCFIIVSFETDGAELQHRFVDTLFGVIKRRNKPHHPGSIASHFHFSIDGKRVVNYAEFVDKESHEEVVQTMLKDDDEIPQMIAGMRGLKPLGFERYHLLV